MIQIDIKIEALPKRCAQPPGDARDMAVEAAQRALAAAGYVVTSTGYGVKKTDP